jgi:chemotaxis protein methyltransferase WspC
MSAANFERLLKQAIGLDADAIGASAIQRAVERRVASCGLTDAHAYWQQVTTSPAELQALVEAVVVPETWFFRDAGAFSALTTLVQDEWLPRDTTAVRILSLPCATGEEPYSIAMSMMDAGVPAARVAIDAMDVSGHALAQARRAIYRRHSFRGRHLTFRSRYFESVPEGYRLAEAVRRRVTFVQGNVFDQVDSVAPGQYDAIFCRNLLIYFDGDTQRRALESLTRLLSPQGVLFVAPSEAAVALNSGLVLLDAPRAFAFRAASAVDAQPKRRIARGPQPQYATLPAAPRERQRAAAPDPRPADIPRAAAANPRALLDEATALADCGRFEEAIARCREHLEHSGPSADAFHLLGLVGEAGGDAAEAINCYRKALYLDPNHAEVLVHLALLFERLGRSSEAQLIRGRVSRLPVRSGGHDARAV